MKNTLLFALLGIGLLSTSCSTAYKSDQTPDDVYYSPGRPMEERVNTRVEEEKKQQYDEYVTNMDDRYLRMKVSNYNRWFMLDDYTYWNDSRYDFNRYNLYGSGWNNYNWNKIGGYVGSGWGYYDYYYPNAGWYNPKSTIITYYGGKIPTPGTTSGSAITAYRNKTYNNNNNGNIGYNTKTGMPITSNNNNSSNNFSSLMKRVFSPASSNSNSSSYDRPARTFDNSSSNNSSARTYSTPSTTTSSSAGGNSGGVSSTGSSASGGRVIRN
jgi:hypothetical protein